MKTKKQLIIEASLEVFSEKGYNLATTLEISKKSGVSEMTLFRHFQTKNKLFLEAIKQAVGNSIVDESPIEFDIDLKSFIEHLMHEKLLMISKHIKLIKMLIQETLTHTLPKELEFTKMIYNQVILKIAKYVDYHKLNFDAKLYVQIIVGLLLQYAIMEENPKYHLINDKEQKQYILNYLNVLHI